MCAERRPLVPRRQRGFSIIELMVGMVVALIVGIAASSSAIVFTASQRQGMGVGGVAVNVSTVLAALKNDAASAGLGFFGEGVYLCDKINISKGTTVLSDGAAFVPVRISRVGGLDRLDVIQSSRVQSGASARLQLPTTGADASLVSNLPGNVDDAVVLSPAAAGDPCLLRSITANTAASSDDPQKLSFAAGGTFNDGTFTTNPSYSAAGGSVTLLGGVGWSRYRMDGSNLVMDRLLDGTSAVLARNVMAFRLQYGVSSGVGGSKTLENWVDATGAWATVDSTTIARLRAVRIGVVTRSPQRDRDCTGPTTVADPLEPANNIAVDVADPQCWRFRSATVVVPLRNLVLGIKA